MGENNMIRNLGELAAQLESTAVDIVARTAPWASPLPTAFLTWQATVKHLGWPQGMGIVAGVIIECLGLAATSTALSLRDYNRGKRKSDPVAPFGLAVALVAVYFGSVVGLTVLLDTLPALAVYAPLAFPVLSLAGVTTLALRSDHKHRLASIAADKAEARAKRQEQRAARQQGECQVTSNNTKRNNLDSLQAARQAKRNARIDALAAFYADNPAGGISEAGGSVGISRQTVYSYLAELESAGRIDRSNGTIKVLQ